MIVSSRKQDNVDKAVKNLQAEGLQVSGVVCHVGKDEDRKRLVNKVMECKLVLQQFFVPLIYHIYLVPSFCLSLQFLPYYSLLPLEPTTCNPIPPLENLYDG